MGRVDNCAENILHLTETRFATKWYRNLSPAGSDDFDIDLEARWDDEANLAKIHSVFDPMIETIHGIHQTQAIRRGLVSPGQVRPYGDTWIIDPGRGSGEYWYHIIDSDIIVVSMNVSLCERAVMDGRSTDMVGLGCYMEDMPMFFVDGLERQDPSLIGYVWKGHRFRQVVEAGARFSSCSISLLPSAIPRPARILRVTPAQLLRAVTLLDGHRDIPAPAVALGELGSACLCRLMEPAYYRAKVIECFALLVSETSRCPHGFHALHTSEEQLCTSVSFYIMSNVAKDLSTRSLSQTFHVSEPIMISAFKRTTGRTPQAYVREARMGHARELLTNTGLSVRQVALCVGYSNQGAFAEAFKVGSGCTPSRYRREKRRHPSGCSSTGGVVSKG